MSGQSLIRKTISTMQQLITAVERENQALVRQDDIAAYNAFQEKQKLQEQYQDSAGLLRDSITSFPAQDKDFQLLKQLHTELESALQANMQLLQTTVKSAHTSV